MKMILKKITAVLAAAALAVCMSVTAFADAVYDDGQGYTDPAADQGGYVDPSQQYTDPNAPVEDPTQQQTQQTETLQTDAVPTETQAPVVTDAPTQVVTEAPTLTQTTYTPPEPTSAPATVKLKVGEVKDKKFTVDILVESPKKIANAQFAIEYDQNALRYESCQHNDEAGGMAVENSFDGKFVYNYVNPDGTAYEGSFCTVTFSVQDEKMTSSALHLTVNDLSDENAVTISCQTESAIVKYEGAPDSETDDDSDYREVKLLLSKSPYTPKDMIADGDIFEVDIDNGEILTYADGKFTALKAGSAKVIIEYADGSVAKLLVVIEDDSSSSAAETTTVTTAAPAARNEEKKSNSLMFILIGAVVVIGIGIVAAEYFLIMKRRDPNDDEYDEYPEEDNAQTNVVRDDYVDDDKYYDDDEYYDDGYDDQPAPDAPADNGFEQNSADDDK